MMQNAIDGLCRIAPKLTENLGLEQIAAAQTCIESVIADKQRRFGWQSGSG